MPNETWRRVAVATSSAKYSAQRSALDLMCTVIFYFYFYMQHSRTATLWFPRPQGPGALTTYSESITNSKKNSTDGLHNLCSYVEDAKMLHDISVKIVRASVSRHPCSTTDLEKSTCNELACQSVLMHDAIDL
jgi:hypothetical protein